MASQVLKNVQIWVDELDVSGQMNALALEYLAEGLRATSIEDTTHRKAGGLKNVHMTHSGFWNGSIDHSLYQSIGGNALVTVASAGSATGDLAYLSQTYAAAYKPKLTIGGLSSFTLELEAAGPLIRGVVLANEDTSSSGTSTPVELGLVQQIDELYTILHVTEISGGTLTVKVEADVDPSFSSPVDAITFSATSATTAEYKVNPQLTADSYYRVSWTLSAGSAAFVVSAGLRVGVLKTLVTRADDQIVLRSGDILIIR